MPRVPPPDVIASWPAPNLANPETRGPGKPILTAILWAIVAAVLLLRLYTRRCISRCVEWDDLLAAAAFVPGTAFAIVGIVVQLGVGWDRHIWDVPVDSITKGLQLRLASFALFDLATTLTKLSILALSHRLAPPKSTRLYRLVLSLVILNLLGMATYLTLIFLQCRPLSSYWILFPAPTPRHCLHEPRLQLISGCWNTTMDLVVVVLPMLIVLRSRSLPRRQTVVVTALFATGWLACVAGAVRTYLLYVQMTAPDDDFTWLSGASYLASSVELYLGIICVSIPATKPFFARFVPGILDYIPSLSKPSSKSSSGYSLKFTKDLEGAELPKQDQAYPSQRPNHDRISSRPHSVPLSSPRRDERRPPDLNKPLPSLTTAVSEAETESRSSSAVVDIGLRVSLF